MRIKSLGEDLGKTIASLEIAFEKAILRGNIVNLCP